MVKEWRHAVTACLMVVLVAGAAQPANAADSAKATQNLTLAGGTTQSQADEKEVVDAVVQIRAGKIQQAIDGPLTDVVNRYEKRYANSCDVVFSARGPVQGLLYLSATPWMDGGKRRRLNSAARPFAGRVTTSSSSNATTKPRQPITRASR
jgi:hypothetical protein